MVLKKRGNAEVGVARPFTILNLPLSRLLEPLQVSLFAFQNRRVA